MVRVCVDETMKISIAKFRSEAVAQAYKTRADGLSPDFSVSVPGPGISDMSGLSF